MFDRITNNKHWGSLKIIGPILTLVIFVIVAIIIVASYLTKQISYNDSEIYFLMLSLIVSAIYMMFLYFQIVSNKEQIALNREQAISNKEQTGYLKRQLETSCQPALIPTIFKSSNSDGPICPSLFLFGFVVKNLGNSLAKDIKYEISFINGKSSESTIDVYCDFYKKKRYYISYYT